MAGLEESQRMKDMMAGLAGLFGSVLLVPVFRWLALRTGFVDKPDNNLKTQSAPVPCLGGLGVWTSWLIMVALLQLLVPAILVWVLLALLLLGSLDDRFFLSAQVRLIIEMSLGAAIILVTAGQGSWIVRVAGSVPVLVACLGAISMGFAVNAVNMVDGMDGLAGSVATLSFVGLGVLALLNGLVADELLALVAAGAMLGFLVYNIPPARVYLGDGGSYATGGFLFYLVLSVAVDWRSGVAALLMVGFFLIEMMTTILRRLGGGSRLADGDRAHSYDKMFRRSNSPWATLARCLLIQGACVTGGLLVATLRSDGWAIVAAVCSTFSAVMLLWVFGGLTAGESYRRSS